MILASAEAAQERRQRNAVVDNLVEVGDSYALLLHRIAMAQGDGVVFERLMVDGDAVRCSDGVLTAVAFADRVFLVVAGREIELEVVDNLAGLFGKPVFADKRKNRAFHRGERFGKMEHYARVAPFELLFLVARAEHTEEHTVDADRGLDDVWSVALVELGVEILDVLARELLVLAEVEVCA